MPDQRPIPVPDEFSADYWEGARRRELTLKQCGSCDFYIHPPGPICPRCQSETIHPSVVSGRGKVYSFSITRIPGNPGFANDLPYAVVIVELDEQAGLFAIGNLLDFPPDDIQIDMPVEVAFEQRGEIVLPQWRTVER